MSKPDFSVVATETGEGVTYTCGCPCHPTAAPATDGSPDFEHCCCGKVHFVGTGAEAALTTYLAGRKAQRKREPDYTRGVATVALGGRATPVAWAFPIE